ncbi:glycoside hydrolase family 26 protein [Williamsia soli]|uniref:glycoside hydrolase family 26 protein n=1 Tax=Williamsia soli TaxID=364929 RepID=UPI001A9D8C25|nr:glycosyl hydrolase [Williamsia soli]
MSSSSVFRVTAVICSVLVASTGVFACSTRTPCSVETASFDNAAVTCLRFGVGTPGGLSAPDEWTAVSELVGERPSIVLAFSDFTAAPPISGLDLVRSTGADPIVTWEPWKHLGGDDYDRSAFSIESIISGAHDDYLYRWADELAAWGQTVYLRFAHEPNGTWYPWSQAGGTSPQSYVRAWRHVRAIFATKNVQNVRWIWAPNVVLDGEQLVDWYPGDDVVDVIGIDGYNWGTFIPGGEWTSPKRLFGESFAQLEDFASDKPILVTEVGSVEQGGSKPEWIDDLVDYLAGMASVSGFVWFDFNKEADWSINSSPGAAAAMTEALKKALNR